MLLASDRDPNQLSVLDPKLLRRKILLKLGKKFGKNWILIINSLEPDPNNILTRIRNTGYNL